MVWDQKAAHWRVEVRAPGGEMRINCGKWDDEADAGHAYDCEAKYFTGKELNFDPVTGEPRPRELDSAEPPGGGGGGGGGGGDDGGGDGGGGGLGSSVVNKESGAAMISKKPKRDDELPPRGTDRAA